MSNYQYQLMSASNSFITTGNVKLNVTDSNFISLNQFLTFLLLDLGLVLLSFILWRILWYSLNRLSIWDIKLSRNIVIGAGSSLIGCLKCLYRIAKSVAQIDNYLIAKCGFQAFTYVYFLRRFMHLMTILFLTDLCVWIPYMLFFQAKNQFSLKAMPSLDNDLFRTFYTLWVTVVVLSGLSDMKNYLRCLIKYKLYRQGPQQKRLLNNLKAKTVHIHFVGETDEVTALNLKSKIIEDLKIQDRIISFLKIEDYTKHLDLIYRMEIKQIVQQLGVDNMGFIWKFFKAKTNEEAQALLEKDIKEFRDELQQQRRKKQIGLNSYFVVFENIQTAEELCRQFETTRAICNILPNFGYGQESSHVEDHYGRQKETRLIVRWAQEPQDIIWVNMGHSEKAQMIKYVLFSFLSILLVTMGFGIMVLSKSANIIQLPNVWGPFLLTIINSTIRFLISKTTEWENRLFQYELQIKEFKVLAVYFVINILVGSVVRDTLNLLDILQTGWGWLELFSLIYKRTDGYFYYLYLCNDIALSVFSSLVMAGNLFPDVYNSRLFYEKCTLIKHKSRFGTNDPFRYGYSYANDVIVISVILLYSTSNPLIHFFGLAYFYVKFYLSSYTLVVFHKYQQTCSNLRMIERVCEFIEIMIICWIFMTATTMMFDKNYSNVLILYLSLGGIIYFIYQQPKMTLQENQSDAELAQQNLTPIIEQWRNLYTNSMVPERKIEIRSDSQIRVVDRNSREVPLDLRMGQRPK